MKNVKMKQELRALNIEQLQEQEQFISKELLSLRLQVKTTHIKDYSRFAKFRRIIACIKTIMREKQSVG
ncbi:MAG TPA: 50S ribosomal protein L29 [Patescibacteria group bacterium]|jgi:ribosomal protein L29|nr:50S ribosomal protein L29 [Patescibacteria group bacterium]